MSARKLVTLTIAALVLITGAAAVGGATPADVANESAVNATADITHQPDDGDIPGNNASDLQANNSENVGPSDGVPDQAADHVADVHERIDGFLNGAIENLGDSLSDLLG